MLDATLTRHPYERDVLATAAIYAAAAQDRAAASRYTRRLRELEPDDPEYARFEAQLQRRQERRASGQSADVVAASSPAMKPKVRAGPRLMPPAG